MAKPRKVDYAPLFEAYEKGQIGASEIAKKYGINRASFLRAYKQEKEKVSPIISNSISKLDDGLNALQEAKSELEKKISNTQTLQGKELKKAQNELEINKRALENGVESLEKKYGALAKAAIGIVSRSFYKADELLTNVNTAGEFNQVMSGLKSGADMIGLFPKSPLVAIQNNINAGAKSDSGKKPFEVKINFLHNKKEKKKDEVIDAEVEND